MAQENISLFSRLSLRQKFGILALLAFALVGVAFYAYVDNQQEKIKVTQHEQQGLYQGKELVKLLQILPRHRGSSTGLLSGNTAMAEEEQATKGLADKQIAVFDGLRKSISDPELQKTWEAIKLDWPKIAKKAADRSVTPNENFQAHTRLIAKVLEVLDLVVDDSGLSLDPYAESYFLMRATLVDSPILTEYLGQARGWGTSLLAKAAKPATVKPKEKGKEAVVTPTVISLQDRGKLSLMTSIANSNLYEATRDFNKVLKYNPSLAAALSGPLKSASQLVDKAITLSEEEIIGRSSPSYSSTEYYKQYTQAIDEMFKMIDIGVKELDAMFNRQIKTANQQMLTISMVIFALIMVFALVALVIIGSMTKPIGLLVGVMRKLAAGDNTVRANLKTNDEIGMLGRQFDDMIDQREMVRINMELENDSLNNSIVELLLSVAKLAQKDLTVKMDVAENVTGPLADALNLLSKETASVMSQVTKIAHQVAEVSQGVQAQSSQVIEVAAEEKREVERAASELGAASAAMLDIAKLAASCNMAAEKAITNTDKAQETVLDTINGITTIRDTIRETEKRIKRLGERSQEIGGVVNLINDIAERTHILALNASMHAASAGEAGRGFAVVANEVQKLAENSREATSKISSLVNNIQVETADTVTTMNNAISQVVRGTELAQQAGSEMQETRDTTANLVELVQTIAASSTNQSAVSQRLLERAKQIQKSTEETFLQLHDQGLQTETLVHLSDLLVSSVNIFTLPKDLD
ncbi:MAG: methyl-accepting chemotaxis protein [Methylovulum miyakonense]|uniref:methyl-accepting chemotaxis protein n=1 Tax=Methylovulum miyakonense TaxID=645578 RepID=UPI003BB626D7